MRLRDEIERLGFLGDYASFPIDPIAPEVIAKVADDVGFQFDPNYVSFLQQCGGFRPQLDNNLTVLVDRRQSTLPDFMFLTIDDVPYWIHRMIDSYSETMVSGGCLNDPEWGNYLIPFAGQTPNLHYCFDYYFDAETPPVVQVLTEALWHAQEQRESHAYTGIKYVADSFLHFLSLMRHGHEDDDLRAAYPAHESDLRARWEQRLNRVLGFDH